MSPPTVDGCGHAIGPRRAARGVRHARRSCSGYGGRELAAGGHLCDCASPASAGWGGHLGNRSPSDRVDQSGPSDGLLLSDWHPHKSRADPWGAVRTQCGHASGKCGAWGHDRAGSHISWSQFRRYCRPSWVGDPHCDRHRLGPWRPFAVFGSAWSCDHRLCNGRRDFRRPRRSNCHRIVLRIVRSALAALDGGWRLGRSISTQSNPKGIARALPRLRLRSLGRTYTDRSRRSDCRGNCRVFSAAVVVSAKSDSAR